MKGKHAKNTANKQKLAKRMLALCFAVVFLCSCVLPVFATGSSLLTDALREAVEETAASTDTSTEAGGGTMMDDFQTVVSSSEYKTTYRFWLSEKDSYDLPDAAMTSASDLKQYADFYAVAAIVNNTTRTAPEGFQNPTDPTDEGRTFEGWYYIDTYGLTQTFTFDDSPVLLDKSATIDVFAQWGEAPADDPADDADKAEGSTEGAATAKPSKAPEKKSDTYKEWYQNLKNTSDESTLSELATEYFKDSGFYSYLGSLPEEEQKELWEKLEPVNMPKVDEADLEETTDADETSEEGIMLLDISAPDRVSVISVGKKLILTSDLTGKVTGYWPWQTYQYQVDHSWSSSKPAVATVESGTLYQTEKAVVTGVAVGTTRITHTAKYWSYDRYGNRQEYQTYTDTYDVTVKAGSIGTPEWAQVYILKVPTYDPKSNDSSLWTPAANRGWKGQVNTYGATWENDKNIMSYAAQYVTQWPDGTSDSVWTLTKDDANTAWFNTVRDAIFDNYKTTIEQEIQKDNPGLSGSINLTKDDITQIKVMPYKISKNNSTTYDRHIDCTIAVVNDKVYTAKFWVMKPGDTKYTQVDARTYLKGQNVEKTIKATIGDTTDFNDIEYILKGWYKENTAHTSGSDEPGAATNERIADYEWNYKPSSTELADGTVNFYAVYAPKNNVEEDQPYITVDKQVTGVSYNDLPSDFGILVDGVTYPKSAAREIDGTDDRNFTLRWKIDAGAGRHTVGEQNYTVDGYDVVAKVNGNDLPANGTTQVTVEAAKITVADPVVYKKCSDKDFLVQATETQENIFVVALHTQQQDTNLVISQNPLSASVREALKEKLNGSFMGSNDWDNSKTAFYSIADHGNKFVIANTIITYNASTSKIHIGATSNWTKAATLTWTKTGGVNPEVTITNSYTSNRADLTVTKTVTGNMADLDEEFTFQMSIAGDYDADKITYKKGTTEEGKLSDLTDNKFTLKNDESIVFSGIPKDAVVTVTETGAEDYKTTVDVSNTPTAEAVALAAETGSGDTKSGTVTISATAQTIAFTNTKEIPVNTGVILDTLPYVLMLIAVGGGVVAFFLRKRHHDDEE